MTPSLMVSTETQRLLFNVGDGIQRMCMEHHVRLAKLGNVFLTQLHTSTVGGLPGMILTISDTGKESLTIHGPEGTKNYLHATRHFLKRPQFTINGMEHTVAFQGDTPCFEDSEVKIYAVPIQKPRVGSKRKLGDTSPMIQEPFTCISYIIETPPQRGKFLVEKAIELGVPKGKLFGQLHQGKDITLVDGRIVRSIDCVSPSIPGSTSFILACPSLSFLEELIHSFHQYQNKRIHVMYHLGDATILEHPKYITWIKSFGNEVEHVLLNYTGCPVKTVYRASAKLQAQLHSVFPHIFPSNLYEQKDAKIPFTNTIILPWSTKASILGESMLKYTLAPIARQGFDASKCFSRLDMEEIKATTTSFIPSSTSSLDPSIPPHLNARITFLGTGCAIPSKYRNVTGIYMEFPTSEDPTISYGIMFDCGEGSLGQLYRYTNGQFDQLYKLIQGLKCIWISHNHADHHLGLLRILTLRQEPLLIIGPTPLEYWLREYTTLDYSMMNKYSFIDNHSFNPYDDHFGMEPTIQKWFQETLGITSFETIPVQHCYLSYAIVLIWKKQYKIVFSGDCRPSQELIDKAQNAFIFIHEATFDETMETEARDKKHSTTMEAINVGTSAHAKHMILTHFSQRYPKLPASLEIQAISAMDLLSLQFSDLTHQTHLMQVCMQILAIDEPLKEEEK